MIFPENMKTKLNNILIVFDAAGYNPVSIQAVIALADKMQANIQALYIEDINLLNAVDLPFVREISLHTAEIRNIDRQLMVRKLRADAESVKKQIEEIALTLSVTCSFRSIRGQKIKVVRDRTEEVAMILIPAVSSEKSIKFQPVINPVVAMIYDVHSQSCDKALNIALVQAEKNNYQLFIVIDSQKSKLHVKNLISQKRVDTVYQIADFLNVEEVLILLKKQHPGLVVLTEDNSLTDTENALQYIINTLGSDILMVR